MGLATNLATWLGFSPAAPNTLQQTPVRPGFIDLIPEGMSLDEYLKSKVLSMPVEKLWRQQPHLRTVVGFVSRNIAQLGLDVFETSLVNGQESRDLLGSGDLLHDLLRNPNDDQTQFELIEATVASRMLYDETYWFVARDPSSPTGWVIRHIPTSWIIGATGATAFSVSMYRVSLPGMLTTQILELPASNMIVFKGWNPIDPRSGVSPVESLKAVLAEQIHAQVFRNQMWEKGGRVGNWIYRPPPGQGAGTAPPWAKETRDKWIEEYRDNYSSDSGADSGGTPLFEDGMELRTNRFSAKDEQFVEASKLSLSTVAQVYFVNPTMVGLLDNANYANVKEFRRALYGDNLGPELERIQQRVNKKLIPMVTPSDTGKVFCEFNLQTKLAGSFEEQGNLLFQAAGGPYMTRNEVRRRQNLPAIDGCDDLIMPLNVTQNGDQNPIPAADPATEGSTLPTLPPPAPEPDEPTKPPPKGGKRNGHSYDGGIRVSV